MEFFNSFGKFFCSLDTLSVLSSNHTFFLGSRVSSPKRSLKNKKNKEHYEGIERGSQSSQTLPSKDLKLERKLLERQFQQQRQQTKPAFDQRHEIAFELSVILIRLSELVRHGAAFQSLLPTFFHGTNEVFLEQRDLKPLEN